MSDTSPLVRQWMLLSALANRNGGVTVAELAREHSVAQKTIRRDLVTLRRAGFPLEESLGDYGRKQWRLGGDPSAPAMTFNWQEAVSLWLARRFLEPLAGTQFWSAANGAFAKIRATLGEQPSRYVDRMAAAFHLTAVRAGYSPAQAEALDRLTQAVEERRVALVGYQSDRATEPVSKEIHPYGLAFHNGATYLVAFATEHGEVRTYKLDRVDYVELTDLRFPQPAGFSLSDYFSGSLGVYGGKVRGTGGTANGNGAPQPVVIRVRFLPRVARYVQEKRWHASQKLEVQRDGSVIAEFRLTTTRELKALILSFGENAILLEPAALRKEMAKTLREALGNYRSPMRQSDGRALETKALDRLVPNPLRSGQSRGRKALKTKALRERKPR
ncbi:MAG: helix-turn-helix transcriptional regulator [Planctomycetaceae bacterium]